MTGLVGPYGSGKTTLSRVVTGLETPERGSVTISVDSERPVGYLPQNSQVRPTLTVSEVLEFYAGFLENVDPAAAVERVGLGDVADRRTDALSGGMRHLLGLAVAVLGTPPLVVLDEPTSGLDPRMSRLMFDVVQDLVSEGTAILLATHDLEHATEADTVAVLHRGRVVAMEDPAELLAATSTDSLEEALLLVVGTEPTVQSGREDET
jgi:ABC-2 type transport system ATP-binding protein